MCGGEGNLFYFSKVVCGVAVQDKLAHWDQGVFCVWPDLGGGRGKGKKGGKDGEKGKGWWELR